MCQKEVPLCSESHYGGFEVNCCMAVNNGERIHGCLLEP